MGFTRRQLIIRGAAGGAAVTLGRALPSFGAPVPLAPYVDALPIPAPMPAFARDAAGNATAFRVGATEIGHKLHRDLPAAKVWAYGAWNGGSGVTGASWPGPTMIVRRGVPVNVSYYNGLPATPLFAETDQLILRHIADTAHVPIAQIPPVRLLTHLHGGHISAAADGNPHHTPLLDELLPGESRTVTYANDQAAALAWYHEHSLGITRSNVYAGLAGGYVITDPASGAANLPAAAQDIPLIIQDRLVDPATGALVYPGPGVPAGRAWIPEFFGDLAVVNGKVWPYVEVEPRIYRLRLLNGCNARFLNLRLFANVSGSLTPTQIGTDLGWLAAPAAVRDVTLAPAERADIVVDFSNLAGQDVELRTMPLPPGVVSPATPLARSGIMQFRVRGTRRTGMAPTLPARTSLPATTTVVVHTMEEVMDPANGAPLMALLDGKLFHDPMSAADRIKNGAVVDWLLVNVTADTHPIHLHLVDFEVVSRQRLDVKRYLSRLATFRADPAWMSKPMPDPAPFLTGKASGPAASERGPKDTVRANPGEVTRIRARFKVPNGTPLPAKYVWHCHILEHEDNDMMRPYDVVA